MSERARAAAAVLLAVALAFALRVIPAWTAVFTPHGISFQEPDAWFHMRTIHNLMAHFPRRSGFDPYGLYPFGRYAVGNVAAAPLWDYMVGSAAWILGAGSPSAKLIDEAGAWLPAILGALFPIPVFFLARRLFGDLAGILSAFWVATIPGSFLWITHLGMPDHHAIESMASFLVLCLLAWGGWRRSIFAGIALGAYLSVRAAGIFVPAILALAALLEPALAADVAIAIGVAGVVFLMGDISIWSNYTWLALGVSLAIAVLSAAFDRIARKRGWPRAALYGVTGAAAVLLIGAIALLQPAKIAALSAQISRFLPWHSGVTVVNDVKELLPLWHSASGGFGAVFDMFGAAWIPAVFAVPAVFPAALRRHRPALTLFVVWSATMIAGVIFQVRMGAYAEPIVAILAGWSSAWIAARIPARVPWLRNLTAAILAMVGIATTVPFAIREIAAGGGPDSNWWSAMDWLRANTPEPMGDPRAWYKFWPAVRPGETFVYPDSAYSVITIWDKGSWITAIAHRIPDANGAIDSGVETARFLEETRPERALQQVRRTGARYAVIGPGAVTTNLPGLVTTAQGDIEQYSRLFHITRDDGREIPLRVYLPAFFRSMGTRLYLFDGRGQPGNGAQVFVTETAQSAKGEAVERVVSLRNFASEKEARAWISANPSLNATLASADPTRSCVETEELHWAKRVFASSEERIAGDRQPTVVKIFALDP